MIEVSVLIFMYDRMIIKNIFSGNYFSSSLCLLLTFTWSLELTWLFKKIVEVVGSFFSRSGKNPMGNLVEWLQILRWSRMQAKSEVKGEFRLSICVKYCHLYFYFNLGFRKTQRIRRNCEYCCWIWSVGGNRSCQGH